MRLACETCELISTSRLMTVTAGSGATSHVEMWSGKRQQQGLGSSGASCSWLSNLLLMGLHTAFRLASAASEPMLALVPSAVAGASRHVLSSTEAHMASIDSAYVSAGKLHAEPSFAACIWLLFAVIVRASPTLPPPRALAAVQLGVVLHFYQGSARWLPLVALLTLGYLLLAAHAEARARREQHAARSAVRELREGTTSPLS